jgi:hypothetical protein
MALRKAYAANQTASAAPARTITLVPPTGDNVFTSGIRIIPYVTDAEDETAEIHVFRYISGPSGELIPTLQGVYTATAGATVGAAGRTVTNTNYFCDTIAVKSTSSDGSEEIIAGGQDGIAELRIPQKGAAYVEAVLIIGTAAAVNALIGSWRERV